MYNRLLSKNRDVDEAKGMLRDKFMKSNANDKIKNAIGSVLDKGDDVMKKVSDSGIGNAID